LLKYSQDIAVQAFLKILQRLNGDENQTTEREIVRETVIYAVQLIYDLFALN